MKPDVIANEAIAIVGLSCRFPEAPTPEAFWKVLLNEKNVISEIPSSRIPIERFFDEDKDADGKTNQKLGAYLENIHHFDPFFFNISPKEAMEMHPSQKLMMELAWESLERSAISYKSILGSNTGVYIGNIWNDFEHFRKERGAAINSFSAIGQSANIIASRISYFLGLTGPSFVVDTGCSSSLVAMALGIQSLRNRTIDMCFTGGINHILNPEQYVYLGKFGGLSSKGQCSAFDADADGFVRAEGAGLIIMKRLSDALRDNNRIYAVVRGYAMNNNGFNENLPATSVKGQLELLKNAYADAGLRYQDIHYVETHGTGTKVGDPNEVIALGELMKDHRSPGFELRIGSVKTNFGHTEAAAGMAGLFKILLSMQHRLIPRNLHFNSPNPKIKFEEYRVKVQDTTSSWPTYNGETLKAGLSSFGWGGTNVHFILEEFRSPEKRDAPILKSHKMVALPVSARSQKALINYLSLYKDFLNTQMDETWLHNVCTNAAMLRPHFEYRALLIGENAEELRANIAEIMSNGSVESIKAQPEEKVVFVFPGQGSQWLGMGRQLYETEKVFKEAIDACELAFKPYADWSLVAEIFAQEDNSQLKKINVIQPAICAIQIALGRLWMSWGILPDAVVGHSMGEVAAANIAGIITLEDAARIICTRSKLMGKLSGTGGAMALTEMGPEEAGKVVEQANHSICIAVQNSPKSTVFAGNKAEIEKLLADLEEQGLFCRMVKVDVASHSPQMDAIKEELRKALVGVNPQNADYTLYSTVNAAEMVGSEMNADYWVNNLRNTVQFSKVIKQLAQTGHSVFIEVSPHPVLINAINENISGLDRDFGVFSSMHREKPEQFEFYSNLQQLYAFGITPKWELVYHSVKDNTLELPHYPFQRESYELESRAFSAENENFHPLLGKPFFPAGSERIFYWESLLSPLQLPLLMGHKVHEKPVFPASAYIEMAVAAARSVYKEKHICLKNLEFHKSIVFDEKESMCLQFRLETEDEGSAVFQVFSKNLNDPDSWELNCSGGLVLTEAALEKGMLDGALATEKPVFPNFYQDFRKVGVEYDEIFRNIEIIHADADFVSARFQLNPQALKSGKRFTLGPVWLDQFIQPAFASYLMNNKFSTQQSAFVASVKNVSISKTIPADQLFTIHILLYDHHNDPNNRINSYSAEIEGYSATDGSLRIKLEGVVCKIIDLGIPFTEYERPDSAGDWFSRMLKADDIERKVVIQTQIIQRVARLIKAPEGKINSGMSFKGLGIDSIMAVQLRTLLERDFKVKFTVADLWKYPSIKAFSIFMDVLVQNQLETLVSDSDNMVSSTGKDIVRLSSASDAKMRLLCFHDAGGSSMLFDEWDKLLGPDYEVMCVQLPGRGDRSDEAPFRTMDAFVQEYLPKLAEILRGKPFVLYGHSMGGLLAFEVARRLENQYRIAASSLVITGTPCLKGFVNTFVNSIIEARLTDEELARLLPASDKIDLSNEVHKQMIRTLRADFELIYSYKYTDFPAISSNIIAVSADSDDRVKRSDVERWKIETTGRFKLEDRKGGHNFVYFDKDYICSLLKEEMAGHIRKNSHAVKSN